MNYLDTSALIKRFVDERGTPLVQAILAREGLFATANIAYAEVYAGLARRHRERDLSPAEYAGACRQFEHDWQGCLRVDLSGPVLDVARQLIQRHPLKGFDAIHLASAYRLHTELGEAITFVAADNRLLRAAEAEGLAVINPESPAARRR
jgi:predicted nucleic acid-binding protein